MIPSATPCAHVHVPCPCSMSMSMSHVSEKVTLRIPRMTLGAGQLYSAGLGSSTPH